MIINIEYQNPIHQLQFLCYNNRILPNEKESLQEEIKSLYLKIKDTNFFDSPSLNTSCFYNPISNTFNAIKETDFYKEISEKNTSSFNLNEFTKLIFNYSVALQKKNALTNQNIQEEEAISLQQYIGLHLDKVLEQFPNPKSFSEYSKKHLSIDGYGEIFDPKTFFILVSTNEDSNFKKRTVEFIDNWTNEFTYYETLVNDCIRNINYSRKLSKIFPEIKKILFEKTDKVSIENHNQKNDTSYAKFILNCAVDLSIPEYIKLFKKVKDEFPKITSTLSEEKRNRQNAFLYQDFIENLEFFEPSDLDEHSKKIMSVLNQKDFYKIFEVNDYFLDYTRISVNLGKIDDTSIIRKIFEKINQTFSEKIGATINEAEKICLSNSFINFYTEYSDEFDPIDIIPEDMMSIYHVSDSKFVRKFNGYKIPIGYEIISECADFPIKEYLHTHKEKLLNPEIEINLIYYLLENKDEALAEEVTKHLCEDPSFIQTYLPPKEIEYIKSFENTEINQNIDKVLLNNHLNQSLPEKNEKQTGTKKPKI